MRNMCGSNNYAPSGLNTLYDYTTGLHPVLIYQAPSGLRTNMQYNWQLTQCH